MRVDRRADSRSDTGLGRIVKPGTLLKQKWTIDKLLGIGGMAAVYAATHRNGKRVAIKMLHEEHSRNVEVTTRFLREGYLANAVNHDGVVSILDDDMTDEGSVFLVMELLEGETVERRWERRDRHLPIVEALSITSELLDILAAAHAKGVIHRDIKPENVFITRTGKVKVLDFGIARLRQMSTGMMQTQSGTLMGTPAFMAPEQARGRWDEVDARTDLWAVGATLFALISGRFVHRAKTLNEQFFVAMTQVAPKIRTVLPDLPAEVAVVVDRALAFKPEDRWQDARAMQAAIRKAYAAVRKVTGDRDDGAVFLSPRSASAALSSLAATGEHEDAGTGTDVFRSLGLGTPATPTIEQGVTNAPSAAPDLRRTGSTRRSPIFVGLTAGAVGVAVALTALVHRPAASPSISLAAHAPHPTLEVGPAVVKNEAVAPAAEVPGLIAGNVGTPSPPATGVPVSMTAEPPPPKRRVAPSPPAQPSATAPNGVAASPAASAMASPPVVTSPAQVSVLPSSEPPHSELKPVTSSVSTESSSSPSDAVSSDSPR